MPRIGDRDYSQGGEYVGDYPDLRLIWIENQGLLGAHILRSLHAAWQRAERHKTSERGASGSSSGFGSPSAR